MAIYNNDKDPNETTWERQNEKGKFTKGDWKESRPSIQKDVFADIQTRFFKTCIDTGDHLGAIMIFNSNEEQLKANAALISESKNLFEMVKMFITVLDPLTYNPVHSTQMDKAKSILNRIK